MKNIKDRRFIATLYPHSVSHKICTSNSRPQGENLLLWLIFHFKRFAVDVKIAFGNFAPRVSHIRYLRRVIFYVAGVVTNEVSILRFSYRMFLDEKCSGWFGRNGTSLRNVNRRKVSHQRNESFTKNFFFFSIILITFLNDRKIWNNSFPSLFFFMWKDTEFIFTFMKQLDATTNMLETK